MNSSNGLVRTSAIALLLILAVYFFFGIFLEDNEAIVAAINYGVLGKMGWEQLWSDYLTFFLPILYHFSAWFPSVPVFGCWKILFSFISLSAIIYYIHKELAWHGVLTNISLFTCVAIVGCLLGDSVFFQHCIRHSILLSFTALLLNKQTLEQKGKLSVPAIFLFALGVVTRMHAAMIVLALFLVYHLFSGTPFLKIVKSHLAMFIIGAMFVISYQLNGIYTSNMGRYIEANYEYALIEKASLYPLSQNATARDTAVYSALKNFFITDSAVFTKAYFEKTVNLNYEKNFSFSGQKLRFAIQELKSSFGAEKYKLLFIPPLLFLMVYGNFSRSRIKLSLVFVLLSMAILFLLLLGLVDVMKVRFFAPYLAMVFITLLMLNFPAFLKKSSKGGQYFFSTVVVLIFTIKCAEMKDIALVEKQKQKELQNATKLLQAYTYKHPLLVFMGADIPFNNNPFYRSSESLFNKMTSFDGGYLIYYSYFQDKFQNLFHCNPVNYPALIDLMERNKELQFYATPERLAMITQYFKSVYHTQLQFEPVSPSPYLSLNGVVYTVKVKRVATE